MNSSYYRPQPPSLKNASEQAKKRLAFVEQLIIVPGLSANLRLSYTTASIAIFTNWDELIAWLDAKPRHCWYIQHFLRKLPSHSLQSAGEVRKWWMASKWQIDDYGKNSTIYWSGKIPEAEKQRVITERKKQLRKEPFAKGMGGYPRHPPKRGALKRWEERERIDEAERKGEIEELDQEQLDALLSDEEGWKIKRV